MSRFRNSLALIAALACLAAGGCISIEQPTLERPRLAATEQELANAAQQSLPVGAKITAPLGGNASSAYVQCDIDGDGANEAIVPYRIDADVKVGVLLLRSVNGAWQSIGTIDDYGHDVDTVTTAELTTGNAPELLLGFSAGPGLPARLDVYHWLGGKEQLLGSASYSGSQVTVGDLNQDGRAELVALDQTTTGAAEAPATVVSVFAATEAELKLIGQDTIDGYPEALLVGNASPDKPAAFVETMLGAHSGCTEIFFLGQDGLTRAFPDPYAATFKPYPLPSADVNGDGIVEVGGFVQPPGTEDLAMVEIPWVQTWQRWDGNDGLSGTILERYVDYDAGYEFDIPASWAGKFTIERPAAQPSEVVFSLADNDGQPVAPLLTVGRYAVADWGGAEAKLQADKARYVLLAERGDQVLVGILPGGEGDLGAQTASEYQRLCLTPASLMEFFRVVPD